MPKKLIVCGKYQNLTKKATDLEAIRQFPFVALVDTKLLGRRLFGGQDFTMIKCFQSDLNKSSFFKKGTVQ